MRGAYVSDHCHWLCREITVSETLFKHKAARGLSQDARKEQGLQLTPAQEKLVARQVNVPYVCGHVMAVVCAWVPVLIGNCAHWTPCGVIHSPTMRCDRLDANNRVHCQRRKVVNTDSNLLRVANNPEIASTSKMTNGISVCAMICECINVVSTDHPCA